MSPVATGRLHALDGMRGVAALVVVFYHVSLLARPFAGSGFSGTAWTVATESPLKLAFAGTEAVQVFFVLSGLVVALPVLKGGVSWVGFLVSRFARLYLPVWGALVFATLLIGIFHRDPSAVTPDAWIINANATSVTPLAFLREATLTPASYNIVNTLWSLRWELIFSALLPLGVAIVVAIRRHAWIAAGAFIALMVIGRVVGNDALVYLPAFLLGSLMAVRLDDIRAWSVRPRPWLWSVVAIGSAGLLVASWIARPLVDSGSPAGKALWGLSGAGAAGLILLAIGCATAARVLEWSVPRWLGKISFSLYLVHAPLLATLAFALGDERWWLVGVIGIPLSIIVAAGFYQIVERPSHRIARWLGARATKQLDAVRQPKPVQDVVIDDVAVEESAAQRAALSANSYR
ncbi:acyltransferase family protein [Plantibacter sp. YIM 135249]|uniref:acyltransferase family protein n=1 Tax=Plantibacter sp. YIM 135249 TaxID=3423918 RepID=UPI003D35644C